MAGAEDFSLLAIAIIIVGMRIYLRWTQVGLVRWQLDDYLMPLMAAVFCVTTVIAYYEGSHGLTNAAMTDEERAVIDFNSREYANRRDGSRAQVILWTLYVFILWGLKLCITVFCSRLTAGLPYLRHRIRFAYVLVGTTYLGVTSTMLLSCRPLPRFWQIKTNPGNSCQPAVSRIFVFVVLIPNIITDIYLLSIPLPGGPHVVVRGSIWACRETFVAIIVTNLPIIHPLFQKCAEKLGLSSVGVNCKLLARRGRKNRYPLRSLSSPRHQTAQPLSDKSYQSTERILADSEIQTQTNTPSALPASGIVVDQEIHITMEPAPTARTTGPGMDSACEGNDAVYDPNFIKSSTPLAPRISTRMIRIGSVIQMYK
ncbi:hypothetical protein F5Y06DRAFT_286012 [Hypoxylon sp. FL0890]|nr:hypothetical protein F5Y06DRAFT_286012 [Hypoxylon sp. FL0890]